MERDGNGILIPQKDSSYEKAHAGLPLVQHPVLMMVQYVKEGRISLEKMVEKMSHAVAKCYKVVERGFLKEGYWADAVIVDLKANTTVTKDNILYKCGWSPLENNTFPASITHTFVNGRLAYSNVANAKNWDESDKGQRLRFDR
jgi:dihydroorotase